MHFSHNRLSLRLHALSPHGPVFCEVRPEDLNIATIIARQDQPDWLSGGGVGNRRLSQAQLVKFRKISWVLILFAGFRELDYALIRTNATIGACLWYRRVYV